MDLEQIQFKLKGEDMIRRLIKKTTFRIAFTALSACVVWQAKAADIKVVSDTPSILILSVTERYTLGDGDTLSDAKKINIENVKKSSADYSGTYVEKMIVVGGSNDDNKITEQQVRVLTSGFVEVVNRDDIRTIGDSGELNLTTTAKVKLSKKAIQDGLAKLKTDPVKAEKIAALEANNKMLTDELYKLTETINNGASRTDLVKKRREILALLNKNRVATKKVFAKGSLFKLAIENISAQENEIAELQDNFYGVIQREMDIQVGSPLIKKSGNGTFDIEIEVMWRIPEKAMRFLSGKIFFRTGNNKMKSKGVESLLDFKNEGHTKNLFDYMSKENLLIEIDFGNGVKGYTPITFARTELNSTEIFITKEARVNRESYGYWSKSPLTIKNVSKSNLEKSTFIKTKVVLMKREQARAALKD